MTWAQQLSAFSIGSMGVGMAICAVRRQRRGLEPCCKYRGGTLPTAVRRDSRANWRPVKVDFKKKRVYSSYYSSGAGAPKPARIRTKLSNLFIGAFEPKGMKATLCLQTGRADLLAFCDLFGAALAWVTLKRMHESAAKESPIGSRGDICVRRDNNHIRVGEQPCRNTGGVAKRLLVYRR
jgi:hypothetical protein